MCLDFLRFHSAAVRHFLITFTLSQVSIMKQEIIDLQPELIKSSKETEELQVLVEADAMKANAKRVSFPVWFRFRFASLRQFL